MGDNRFLADQISEILFRNKGNDSAALREVERFICIKSGKVHRTKHPGFMGEPGHTTCDFYITTARVDRKFQVPEHPEIPRKMWGQLVECRQIRWEENE